MTLNGFLKDKPDGFKIEIGARSGYFFYGTKSDFNEFIVNGRGHDMKPKLGSRHIIDSYKSELEPDYTILLVEGSETGRFSYPGDNGDRE